MTSPRSKLDRPSAPVHSSGERPRVSVPTNEELAASGLEQDAQIEIGEAEIDADELGMGLEMGERDIDESLGGLELDLSSAQQRAGVVDALLEEAVAELAASSQRARQEQVEVDRSVRVPSERAPAPQPSHASGMQSAVRVVSAEEVARLRELHDKRKRTGHLAQADRERYDVLRERFARAFLAEQHLDLRAGQTYRRAFRVPCAYRLTLSTAARAYSTITLDLSECGLAALVGSTLAAGSTCELVLHIAPEPIRATAQIVSCVRHGSGSTSHRVSLELDPLDDRAAERLEILVLDAALRRALKRD